MKQIMAIFLFLGLALGQTALLAKCETHSGVTYCLAGANQVEYLAHSEEGFVPVLFAQEATVDGKKQTDFAGQLDEGSRVQFRGGIVVILPEYLVGSLASFAKYLDKSKPRQSSQATVICARMELGDSCKGNLEYQTWSVSLWINKFPAVGSGGYSMVFFIRDTGVDPASYTLPKEPFAGTCACENNEYPGIFVLLKQEALAKFQQPQPQMADNRHT